MNDGHPPPYRGDGGGEDWRKKASSTKHGSSSKTMVTKARAKKKKAQEEEGAEVHAILGARKPDTPIPEVSSESATTTINGTNHHRPLRPSIQASATTSAPPQIRLLRPADLSDPRLFAMPVLDGKLEIAREFGTIEKSMTANDLFRVVGAVGGKDAGRSTVLSLLTSPHRQPLSSFFPKLPKFKRDSACLDMFIEGDRRIFLLEAPALSGRGSGKELSNRGVKMPSFIFSFGMLSRFRDFRMAVILLTHCNVLFVVAPENFGGGSNSSDVTDTLGGGGDDDVTTQHETATQDFADGETSVFTLIRHARKFVMSMNWPCAQLVVVRNRVPPLMFGQRRVQADEREAAQLLSDTSVKVIHVPMASSQTATTNNDIDVEREQELGMAMWNLQRAALGSFDQGVFVPLRKHKTSRSTETEWLSSLIQSWEQTNKAEVFDKAQEWTFLGRRR